MSGGEGEDANEHPLRLQLDIRCLPGSNVYCRNGANSSSIYSPLSGFLHRFSCMMQPASQTLCILAVLHSHWRTLRIEVNLKTCHTEREETYSEGAAARRTAIASATFSLRLSGDSITWRTSAWSISRSMPVILVAFAGSIASIIG